MKLCFISNSGNSVNSGLLLTTVLLNLEFIFQELNQILIRLKN